MPVSEGHFYFCFFIVDWKTTSESTGCHDVATGFFEECIMYNDSQLGKKISVGIFGVNGPLNELGFLGILILRVWFEGSQRVIVIIACFLHCFFSPLLPEVT